MSDLTAAAQRLAVYHTCGLLTRLATGAHHAHGPRGGTPVYCRKPDGLAHTWALLIAAYVLYVPANLLPVVKSAPSPARSATPSCPGS